MTSILNFVSKDINNVIFATTGLALTIQGVVTFIYFQLDSTEKLIEKDVGTTNKFLQLFEIDFLFNAGLFFGGFGLGLLVKFFEKIILDTIGIKNKLEKIIIKVIITLAFLLVVFVWAFFLLPKTFEEKSIEGVIQATVTPKQQAHIIYAIQLMVIGAGFTLTSILYEVYEIFEKEINRLESKDLPQVAGGGFIIASVLLILQSISNIIGFIILGFSAGNKWFFALFVTFLVIGVLGVAGSIALIVV